MQTKRESVIREHLVLRFHKRDNDGVEHPIALLTLKYFQRMFPVRDFAVRTFPRKAMFNESWVLLTPSRHYLCNTLILIQKWIFQ